MSNIDPTAVAKTLRQLRKAVESSKGDLGSMPFFVRPMVKRGFERRTGRSFDAWLELIASLIVAVENGSISSAQGLTKAYPELPRQLSALAPNFRTAPERAKRGMSGKALDEVSKRSAERASVVDETCSVLGL